MGNSTYLATKPRYEILDGLRGVAAILVVAFHILEPYSGSPEDMILAHGYLAVDFFFVLSGFVIGYAYDDRWGEMSVGDFFKRRIIRLHPMVVLGSILGFLLYYFSIGDTFPLVRETSAQRLILVLILGCLMIPSIPSSDTRGWGEMFSLNGPSWSLFWEYVANILYALCLRRLSKRALIVCTVAATVLTLNLCLNLNLWGTLDPHQWVAYTVIGGWGIDPAHSFIAASRLLYPLLIGLLISKLRKQIEVKGGFWWSVFAMVLLLVCPRIGGEISWMNGVYEAICILLLFPLIVSIGAGSHITDKRSAAVCRWLGEVSYPLYLVHYPLVYIQVAWVGAHADAPIHQHIILAVATFILSIGMAYSAYHLYDLPVRRWLKRKLFATQERDLSRG